MSVKRGRLPSVGTHGTHGGGSGGSGGGGGGSSGGSGGGKMAPLDEVKVTRRVRSLSASVKAAPPRRNTILME